MQSDFVQLRKMLESRLMMRAVEDAVFREHLLKDPRAAIEEEFGKPFPFPLKLQAIEEPADTLLLVVPQVSAPNGELSDSELEAVSGGSLWSAVKEFLGIGTSVKEQAANSTGTAVAGVRG